MATSNSYAAAVPQRDSPQRLANALPVKPVDLGLGNAPGRLTHRVGQQFVRRRRPVAISIENQCAREAVPGVLCGNQFSVYQNHAVCGEAFTQSHIVRQTPAESELSQEVYPAQAVFLVRAQFPVELLGRIDGLDAIKTLQLVAGAGECLVEIGLGLRAKERIEHADLRLAETQMVFVGLAESCDQAVSLQPVFGQHPVCAVVELDHAVAALQRRKQFGKPGCRLAEIDRAVEFEPVNAGVDLNLDLAGAAESFTFGLDAPAFRDQFPDAAGELRRGDLPTRLLLVIVRPDVLQAGLGQAPDERRFGVPVAQDVVAALDQVDAPARIVLVDDAAPRFWRVIEGQARAQPGALFLRLERQTGLRFGVDLLIPQLFGQIDPGRLGFAQDFRHELADLIFGNEERADLAQDRNPVKRAPVVERGGAFGREDQTAVKDQGRLRQVASLLTTAQNAFDNVLAGPLVVAANPDRKPPRFALLPFDLLQFVRIALRLQVATSRLGDQRQDDLRQRRCESVAKRGCVISVLVIVTIITVIRLLAGTGEHGENPPVGHVGQTGDLPSRYALFARPAPFAVLLEVLKERVKDQMLRFERGTDVDYVNDPAHRRPFLADPGDRRARGASERGQLLSPTRDLLFRTTPADEYGVHVARRLIVLLVRPLVVITVVKFVGAITIEGVVVEIRDHFQRPAAADVALKVSLSFHGQNSRPEMLARLALESRAFAMDDERIPLDFEFDSVSPAPAHSGLDLPVGTFRDPYPAFLKIICAARTNRLCKIAREFCNQ